MSFLPQYTHIINPKLKHIYLTFDDEGNLIIKSPKVSQKQIEKLLLNKASWITKSKLKIQNKKGMVIHFDQEPEFYFLGESHSIHLHTYNKKRTTHSFDGDIFTIYYNQYDESMFQKQLNVFYKEEAKKYIPTLVAKWSQKMNLPYNEISFRKTKRQWGSCSSKNNLSFNTMMMKLPLNVIEYIIVHELAHIKYKHHQKDFWELVALYLPNYKDQVNILKQYST